MKKIKLETVLAVLAGGLILLAVIGVKYGWSDIALGFIFFFAGIASVGYIVVCEKN